MHKNIIKYYILLFIYLYQIKNNLFYDYLKKKNNLLYLYVKNIIKKKVELRLFLIERSLSRLILNSLSGHYAHHELQHQC